MIAGSGDLRGGQVGDWLVTGWFTPNYRPLAETFAANLTQHGAPYHLWAKPPLGEWNTTRKPSVVLETIDAYPGKTIVLMDVDCIAQGDIEPVTRVRGDVGIVVIARNMRRNRWAHWLAVECSSRVVVFRPTEKARTFAQTWADTIEQSAVNHDEHSMAWAYLSSTPRVDLTSSTRPTPAGSWASSPMRSSSTTAHTTSSGGQCAAALRRPYARSSGASCGQA